MSVSNRIPGKPEHLSAHETHHTTLVSKSPHEDRFPRRRWPDRVLAGAHTAAAQPPGFRSPLTKSSWDATHESAPSTLTPRARKPRTPGLTAPRSLGSVWRTQERDLHPVDSDDQRKSSASPEQRESGHPTSRNSSPTAQFYCSDVSPTWQHHSGGTSSLA